MTFLEFSGGLTFLHFPQALKNPPAEDQTMLGLQTFPDAGGAIGAEFASPALAKLQRQAAPWAVFPGKHLVQHFWHFEAGRSSGMQWRTNIECRLSD